MKNILPCIFLFISTFFFSQEKKIEFSKVLKYEMIGSKQQQEKQPVFTLFGNNNGEFLTTVEFNYFPIKLFSDDLGMIPVNLELDNNLTYSKFANYYMGNYGYNQSVQASEITTEKLESKETIFGLSCNNYIFSFPLNNLQNEDIGSSKQDKMQICIDESNSLNNVPILFGIINQTGIFKVSIPKVKGLVLKITPKLSNPETSIILKSIKDTKTFVNFNHGDAMMEMQKRMDSIMAVQKKYNEDDSAAVMVDDSAAVMVDSAATMVNFDNLDLNGNVIEKYNSTYKNEIKDFGFNIESIDNIKSWEMLPIHCRNLDKNLPMLSSKTFNTHLKNLNGQLCDLYYTQNSQNSVEIKMTVDEVRREILFLNENKKKLNAADQKKVDNYLENLD